MNKYKIVLDQNKIDLNGHFATTKSAVFEIEPIITEMLKELVDGQSLVVRVNKVDKGGNLVHDEGVVQEELDEGDDLHENIVEDSGLEDEEDAEEISDEVAAEEINLGASVDPFKNLALNDEM